MVTKNWYTQVKTHMAMTTIPNSIKNLDGSLYTSGYANNNYGATAVAAMMFQYSTVTLTHASNSIQSRGICLGSGTTAATIDDYMLENPISSGLSAMVTKVYDDEYNRTWVITLTNTSSDDITIGEIGYAGEAFYAASGSYSTYALYDRTVLDSPITIPAGGVGQINYTIRFQFPAE